MTRLALAALALALVPAAAAGQAELRPGTFKLSGATDLSFAFTSTEVEEGAGSESDTTVFRLSTSGAWFLTPSVGLGARAEVERQEVDLELAGSSFDSTSTTLTVGPLIALHFPVNERAALFGEAALGLTRADLDGMDLDGWTLGGRAGVAFFLAPSISLDLSVNAQRSWTEASDDGFGTVDITATDVGAQVGLSVYLGP